LPHLAVWLGIKQAFLYSRILSGCFMLKPKKRFFKVFCQFISYPSRIAYFAHYYPINAEKKPSSAVRTLGDSVSVFQYTDTPEEAAALMSSMFDYAKDKAFLSLPYKSAFNGGQQFLF
jgi:hypothetical protein